MGKVIVERLLDKYLVLLEFGNYLKYSSTISQKTMVHMVTGNNKTTVPLPVFMKTYIKQ